MTAVTLPRVGREVRALISNSFRPIRLGRTRLTQMAPTTERDLDPTRPNRRFTKRVSSTFFSIATRITGVGILLDANVFGREFRPQNRAKTPGKSETERFSIRRSFKSVGTRPPTRTGERGGNRITPSCFRKPNSRSPKNPTNSARRGVYWLSKSRISQAFLQAGQGTLRKFVLAKNPVSADVASEAGEAFAKKTAPEGKCTFSPGTGPSCKTSATVN